MTKSSAFHSAFRLQETARGGFVSFQYIVSSKGDLVDLDDCIAILPDWMMLRRPLVEGTAKHLLVELLERYTNASDLSTVPEYLSVALVSNYTVITRSAWHQNERSWLTKLEPPALFMSSKEESLVCPVQSGRSPTCS